MSSNYQRYSVVLSSRPCSYRVVNCVKEYHPFTRRKINWVVQFVVWVFFFQFPHSWQMEPSNSGVIRWCLKIFFMCILAAWSKRDVRAQYLFKPHTWNFKLSSDIFNGMEDSVGGLWEQSILEEWRTHLQLLQSIALEIKKRIELVQCWLTL